MDAPCLVKTYRVSNAYSTSIISLVPYTRGIYMVGMVGMVIIFLRNFISSTCRSNSSCLVFGPCLGCIVPSTPLLEVLMAFSFGVLGFRAALSDFHTEFSVLFLYSGFSINHQPTNSPNAQRSKVGWPYYGGTVDCRLYLVGLWYVVCGPHHQSLRFGAELQLGSDLLKPVLKGFKNWVLTSFRTELWGAICRFRVFSWSK